MRLRFSSRGFVIFDVVSKIILLFITAFCLFPFTMLVIGSFTDNVTVLREGYSFLPSKMSVAAYDIIFKFPKRIIDAYRVTITVTAAGSLLGVLLISISAYVLMRTDFRSRNTLSFFIYFTSIFQGGLIPWYILITNYLKLVDSLLALILPSLMSPFLIILMRNFLTQSIPMELIESAKIDGANDIMIFYKIVFRLAAPGVATVGLFLALGYWNEWYMTMLFIRSTEKYTLQFYLYNMLNAARALAELASQGGGISVAGGELPTETTKLAMAVIATGPVIMAYPFIQRYFVRGLTIGAVKG